MLQKRLLPFCDSRRLTQLKRLDVDTLRAFRNSWKDCPIYALKNLERLRSFLRFCRDSHWIHDNPALALKPPKVDGIPTLPFTQEEMKKILDACDRYRGNKDRVRAFVLTLRYAGLRIGDTVTLKRDRLQGNKLLLYQHKTGTPVYVPVPDSVVEAVNKIDNGSPYFFWTTGRGAVRTLTANWQRVLSSVFKASGVEGGHAHRFRDTFAVELLLRGVPIDQVSILLGHASIKVTEKHYAPWVKSRQEQLEAAVRKAWA